MAWIYLILAGVFEVFWSTCLKLSDGLHIVKFSVLTLIGLILSFLFLAQATKSLPLGNAYGIWTGIGALGAVIVGVVLFHEAFTPERCLFFVLLLVGIVGLQLTSQ